MGSSNLVFLFRESRLSILFFLVILFFLGCADENPNGRIRVLDEDYLIPQSYLTYLDDFSGGNQSTVTINAIYPQMSPQLGNKEEHIESVRIGKGLKIILKSHGTSPLESWNNIYRYRKNLIVGYEKSSDLTRYLTKKTSMFEYYTFTNNNNVFQLVTCPKRKSVHNFILCRNDHKTINDEIYVTYLFSDKLLSEVKLVDKSVEE